MTLPTKPPAENPLRSIPLVVWIVPAVMLLIATLRLPYGYYQLLRLIVCPAAGFIVWRLWGSSPSRLIWALPLGLLALAFNPVLPIRATRSIWLIANLVAAGVFAVGGVLGWRVRRAS